MLFQVNFITVDKKSFERARLNLELNESDRTIRVRQVKMTFFNPQVDCLKINFLQDFDVM